MLIGTNFRDPVLINTIGHTAGLLLFGLIIGLLIRDQRAHGVRRTTLSLLAAALALAWNIGSLLALALAFDEASSLPMRILMAVSFSVLSLLPAILLQLALKGGQRLITQAGYAVSAGAIALHVSELFAPHATPHQWALILIAGGFGVLTVAAFLMRQRDGSRTEKTEWLSLGCLLLFTSSFLHFGYQHVGSPWAAEIAWHHIGIPVALIVLLQDYRFLLLDTFVRFLTNSALAAGYLTFVLLLNQRFQLWRLIGSSRFLTGLALVSLCLSLILFAHMRNILQRWVGSVVFRRQDLAGLVRVITQLSSSAHSEEELLSGAAREVANHLRADLFIVVKDARGAWDSSEPTVLFGQSATHSGAAPAWAEAQIPLRFSSGEIRYLLTGPRRGRQRYLSEDLEDMRRLGSVIVEQVERFRSEELRRLATQAELRALQAQINPHFFFNALNTLYGSIDRNSFEARRMVLNLAEIFRYFLKQGEVSFIPLSEELRIVQAYLEIEALRLGDRLEAIIDVPESIRSVMLPALLIQPLVENAIKHGIATQQGPGRVSLRAHCQDGKLRVTVADTGPGFDNSPSEGTEGCGIGLENVRRRLRVAYGADTSLDIESSASGSSVTFLIGV